MNKYFKLLVAQISNLSGFVTNNSQAWSVLKDRELKEDEFLTRFFYPLTGISMLSLFISNLFFTQSSLARCLQEALIYFTGMFIGIFSLAFVFYKVSHYFQLEFKKKDWVIFTGVNLSILMIVDVVYYIFSQFVFIKIVQLFMIYSVFNGINHFFKIDASSANSKLLLLLTAICIYIFPHIIKKLLLYCI